MAVQLVLLDLPYDDALSLTPPSHLQAFHDLFVEGLRHCDLAVDKIVSGIDGIDADLMTEGSNLIVTCGALVEEAGDDPNW